MIVAAAGAAKATKARDFYAYVLYNGAYMPVYVPYDCPDIGYGCTFSSRNGTAYQVYEQIGIQFYPLKP
jgi:hypothetical protein